MKKLSEGQQDRIKFYMDESGKIRWRMRAAGNNAILADSGQGYKKWLDAWSAAARVTGRDPDFEPAFPSDILMVVDKDVPCPR